MRLLWISDSPDTPSGFGNVTRSVCQGLARRGHDVSIMGWQTKQPHDWNGCKVYPSLGRLASDTIFPFLVRHRPEVVIALADVWWLPYFCAPHVRRQMELTDTPWALYFPIDGDMEGERLPASWIELLREVDVPVAMSRYGKRIAEQQGVPCHYIPHGVDLDLFCQPPDREQAKGRVGAAGKFLILSDSRNQPRKMLPRLLDVFAKFAKDRPDALLHLHTDPEDEFTQSGIYSYDVRADVRHLGIEPQVHFSSGMSMQSGGGLPLPELAAYYQAADVHLLASSGEGFGLPTLQAAAAGAVPMAGAYTASLELTEGHGEPIAIADWTENEFGIRRGLIDVDDAVLRLGRLYDDRGGLRERSVKARQFALSYGWDPIVDQWDRLLRSLSRSRTRIARLPVTRTETIQKLAPGHLPNIPGVSVSVKVVERQLGHTEAAILADARRLSDVRIPVLPQPCEVADVRVPRTIGHLGMGPASVPVFVELKRIFPILSGWVALPHSAETTLPADLEYRTFHSPEELRFDLAQSVLLLDFAGELPVSLLIDAALYGVPCISAGNHAVHRTLWPDLGAPTHDGGAGIQSAQALFRILLEQARGLLTDAARMERASSSARKLCRELYAPDEDDSAFWLRQLHARHLTAAAIGAAR